MKGCLHWTLGVLTALAAFSCSGPLPEDAADLFRITATTGMLGDAAARIGGGRVQVRTLMGPGVDPHLYKPAHDDLRALSRADLILHNGLKLEGRMGDVLAGMAGRARVHAAAEAIPRERLLPHEDYPDEFDPHIWFDVGLWRLAAAGVAEAMAAVDPAHAAEYAERAAVYDAELAALDAEVREQLAALPPERRVLVTAHDAFGYFGRAYGFEVLGLQGMSTAAELGIADIDALAKEIASRRIPAVFVETSVPPRSIEALIAGVRARGHDVALGGELYSDALGGPGSGAEDYAGMVRHNVRVIVEALR